MSNKLFLYFALLMLFIGGGLYYYEEIAQCRPVAYDIGAFDNRFGISRDKFLKTIKESEAIWESGTKKNLFEYKPGSSFKVNLIFDERQGRTIDANRSKEEIEGSRAQYDSILAEYKALAVSYERDLREYNSQVASFEARLSSYNAEVAKVNAKGGAKPNEYQGLEVQKKSLESEKSYLDRQRIILNGKASELNQLGESVNALAKELNIEVDVHNQRFGDAREFEQGETVGRREINIYQFDTTGDLRLVLAHELGHAIGLEHVENPKSMMYYLMDEQDPSDPILTKEDIAAIKDRCNLK